METLNIVLLLVNAFLLLALSVAYIRHTASVEAHKLEAARYTASFVDVATAVENIAQQQDDNEIGIELNAKEIQIVRTILSIHSEALRVKRIEDLFDKFDEVRTDIVGEEHS